MLRKIKNYYTEDGEQVNIEDEKIYWDTKKNQFRHRFDCGECKVSLGCRCYETLLQALNGVDNGMVCESCGISDALNELNVDDLMYKLDDARIKQIKAFADTLLIECLKKIEWEDKLEIIEEGDEEEKLKEFIIGLMTVEEKRDEFFNSCDEWAEGESCNI